MRLFVLCCVFLTHVLAAHAEEVVTSSDGGSPPLSITAPAGQPVQVPPAWIDQALADRQPAPSSALAIPFVQPGEQAQTAAPANENAAQAEAVVEPPPARRPESAKSGQRGKKTNAPRNTPPTRLPSLLAASPDQTASPPRVTTWRDLFPAVRTSPVAEATFPPLRPGIRASLPQQPEPPLEEPEPPVKIESVLTKKLKQKDQDQSEETPSDTQGMLVALVDLQKNLRQQITATNRKLKASTSEAEKTALQEALAQLDQQLSDSTADFERIATGVEPSVFTDQKQESFNWKDELTTLLQPSIKELKQLTARARQKTELKGFIADFGKQAATARRAVEHLNIQIEEAKDSKIKTHLRELLPAWQNMEKRIQGKLDIAQRELVKLEEKNGKVAESASLYIKDFFRERGLYLLLAFVSFGVVLLLFRLLHRLLFKILPGALREQRPFYVRVLHIALRVLSVFAAFASLVFVLYTAEDWLLLSVAIILLIGVAWGVRQTLPKLWQQARIVLNMGSVREGERVIYSGVAWKVESLNVFCKLSNPALGMQLRIPVEDMVGLISRPFSQDEPWFPCKKDDWVAIDGKPFAKVVSLSPEQVEVVELGGRRIIYPTGDFLATSPANLSRNFSMRVVFGLSYDLQAEIATTVPERLRAFLEKKLKEQNFADQCLNLAVDFLQAGPSSLDLAVLADFKGEAAPAYRRIERAFNRWCVECCNEQGWEIPFPQMTVHRPAGERP